MLLKLENMTVRQKLGMVFCARRFREEDVDFIIELLQQRAHGCIQLSPTSKVNEKILAASDYPVLIFCDMEKGFPTTELPLIPLRASIIPAPRTSHWIRT